jgi:hypothetical protein
MRSVEKPDNRIRDIQERIKIPGVENLILQADADSARCTPRLAADLMKKSGNDKQYFQNIHSWVRKNIRYKEDDEIWIDSRGEKTHLEKIRSPGRLVADRVGDCKSMAVFVGSLLQNSGHKYFYRLARYDPSQPDQGHIYVVAKSGTGKEYAIDPVLPDFNSQPSWWKKKDIMETTGIYVSGLKNNFETAQKQSLATQNQIQQNGKKNGNNALIWILLFFALSLD